MNEQPLDKSEIEHALELELSDEDILDALAHVSGYIDISTEDFRTVYHLAWRHALARLQVFRRMIRTRMPPNDDRAPLARVFTENARTTRGSPPRVSNEEMFWSWVGAFLGITALVWSGRLFFDGSDLVLMIGSFGASAVLLYGAVRSRCPAAQCAWWHMISALIGVLCWKLLQPVPWLAPAVAVATAIAVMHATRTLHPPGGATALIAVIGSPESTISASGTCWCRRRSAP